MYRVPIDDERCVLEPQRPVLRSDLFRDLCECDSDSALVVVLELEPLDWLLLLRRRLSSNVVIDSVAKL
jgi:hypothetical protein